MEDINTSGARCSHPACECLVLQGHEYCSDYCKMAGLADPEACRCGHQQCNLSIS